MTLHDVLRRENNNLDLFRLIAAYLVIIGHAYALAPQAGQQDPILRLLGFDYSGSMAVKLFFFLSGLVVVNSLLDKRDVAYGVYLWGFPVQQVFAESWPQAGPLVNQMVSLPVATVAGVISWYLVEKRFIAIGRNVQRRMKKTDAA